MKRFCLLLLLAAGACAQEETIPPVAVVLVEAARITVPIAVPPQKETVNLSSAFVGLDGIHMALALPDETASVWVRGVGGAGLDAISLDLIEDQIPASVLMRRVHAPGLNAIGLSLVVEQIPKRVNAQTVSEILRWVSVNDWLNARPANARNWVSGAKTEIADAIAKEGYTTQILERAEALKK